MKSIHNLKQYILKMQPGGSTPQSDDVLPGTMSPEAQAEFDKIQNRRARAQQATMDIGASLTGLNMNSKSIGDGPGQLSQKGALVMAGVGKTLQIGAQAADAALMGGKNFDGQSQAIDSTVHGVSGALMQSGNPYAILAGGILEGANFLTKAGGQTTTGYDVNIDNSGYGTLGHMESKSNRVWVSKSKLQQQLEYRNAQARMALDAAEISADQQFEQEARKNSVSNTIMNNREALAGGYDTNTLGE